MDDKSYNNLRAELLYDDVIENLLSLVLSQVRLEYFYLKVFDLPYLKTI